MTDVSSNHKSSRGWAWPDLNKWVAKPSFQAWAAWFPLTRRFAARDGAQMFDLVQGFVQSQVLMALVKLDVPAMLIEGPKTLTAIAHQTGIPEPRAQVLVQAGSAMGLLKTHRDGRIGLARKGAALVGVPGLQAMIRHHDVLYRDLADPVAFFQGPETTELSGFWPYVFGAGPAVPEEEAKIYTDLMAQSQEMVAADTLNAVSLNGIKCLMDVGGGSGVFLEAAAQANPDMNLHLFDLPNVVAEVPERLRQVEQAGRLTISGGSFKSDALPTGPDAISLIRVLYDHADETVTDLLAKAFAALPPGGKLIISEPMSGGAKPDSATDVYFAVYTMAMQTGCTRSARRIEMLCTQAGFDNVRIFPTRRSFVTQTLIAQKPG